MARQRYELLVHDYLDPNSYYAEKPDTVKCEVLLVFSEATRVEYLRGTNGKFLGNRLAGGICCSMDTKILETIRQLTPTYPPLVTFVGRFSAERKSEIHAICEGYFKTK